MRAKDILDAEAENTLFQYWNLAKFLAIYSQLSLAYATQSTKRAELVEACDSYLYGLILLDEFGDKNDRQD